MIAKMKPRPEGCLSDLVFDRLLAIEGSASADPSAQEHLRGCAACRARLASLTKARDAFAVEPPLVVPTPRSRRRWAWAVPCVAAAAAMLLLVHARLGQDGGETTRSKGASHIGFYVKRGESVSLGASGQRVGPGDSLRFVYSTPRAGYLAILSLDGNRHATIYFPDGLTAAPVDAAVDRPLEMSTVLDGAMGEEHIYGLFCAEAVPLESVRARLEAGGVLPELRGCEVDALVIHKEGALAP